MTLPSWVPAGEPKPAPAPLLLVQSFVNTRDLDRGTDLLADPETASGWLRQAGILGRDGSLAADDLRGAREVRESIRALLARNAAGPPSAAGDLSPLDVSPLRELAAGARPQLAVGEAGRVELGPGSGRLADGLAGLLLIIRDAQHDGTWQRLKTCANQDCQWAYFDRSHSRRGNWCDMASCGNLIKNRNLRRRRGSARAAAPPDPSPGT